ncbi:MAG: hypothetical protein VX527_07535 [Planctomycetota bacterium]|nr:hypothetical protein [Planctomycetota bacterium]
MSAILAMIIGLLSTGAPTVHSVSDISQQFTFYMDGRFHRQYLKEDARDVRNWGSLSELDLSNANLLILTGGDVRIPYDAGAKKTIARFLGDGGTVLVMADGTVESQPIASVLSKYGVTLKGQAKKPLRGLGELSEEDITFRRGGTLELDAAWTPLIVDSQGHPVLAERRVGSGTLVLGSRGLFGQKPDASDPINDSWVGPMLVNRASRKKIDPSRPHRRTWAEDSRQAGPLKIEFHDGTEQFADNIVAVYEEVRPHLLAITGVEPSPGMIQRLLILPTGGGGFSSGVCIAIGAWWGGFPEKRYPMVELISHEAGHSWVLPYAEPLWNEPIATWLGIQVGRRMNMPEAEQTLERQLRKGRRHDPEFTKMNPMAKDAPRDLVWGKSYYVFETLEKNYGPGAMAKYFKTKREVLEPGREAYTMDDCVAVWSLAVNEDLFPWFQSLAFDVDRNRTDLPSP